MIITFNVKSTNVITGDVFLMPSNSHFYTTQEFSTNVKEYIKTLERNQQMTTPNLEEIAKKLTEYFEKHQDEVSGQKDEKYTEFLAGLT